jgi:hypothetical protein
MNPDGAGPDADRPRESDPPAGSDPGGDAAAPAARNPRDFEAIAAENRAKTEGRVRLRADVLSLASRAVATLRELVSGSEVPPAVRLRASLAILQAADAIKAEEIGPTTASGVRAKRSHDAFVESMGG